MASRKNEYYESEAQLAADEMAFTLIKQQREFGLISIFQSYCDFNLSWLFQISPMAIRIKSLEFLVENKHFFKRKLSIKEVLYFDSVINNCNPETFNEFKKMIT